MSLLPPEVHSLPANDTNKHKRLKRLYRIRARSARLAFIVETGTAYTCHVTMCVGLNVTMGEIWDTLQERIRQLVHPAWSLYSIYTKGASGAFGKGDTITDMTQTWRQALHMRPRTHTYAIPPITLNATAAYDASRIHFIDAYATPTLNEVKRRRRHLWRHHDSWNPPKPPPPLPLPCLDYTV